MDARKKLIEMPPGKQLPVVTLTCAQCGNPNGPRVQYAATHLHSINFNGVEVGWGLTDYTPGGEFTARCPNCTRHKTNKPTDQ